MKKAIRSLVALAAMAFAVCAHGFVLPLVGTGTELNKWSRNMSGVLAAAKTTGYPIFLVMINDSSTGEGCGHCKLFVERTLNTSEFEATVRDYKFYMVLLNYWGSDTGRSQPNYGGVSSAMFMQNFYAYASDRGYPVVAVIRPDGRKYKGWGDSTNPSTRGTTMNQLIRQAIADLAPRNADTTFTLAAENGNTVSVPFNGTDVQPGTWSGIVKRTGGSGVAGTVALSLSGANAARYRLSTTTLAWDVNDGSKSFTVTGPESSDGGIVSDTITVSIAASGFDGSDVKYGTQKQTITFKDARVKQSLAEFAAANSGLEGLASTDGMWFVPASGDGNILETVTDSSSTLAFTAKVGGVLTVGVGADNPGTMEVTANGEASVLAGGETVRFGVEAGQKITFKAVAGDVSAAVAMGFSKFAFTPLAVTLVTPKDGTEISYDAMMSDKARVNLEWAANRTGCTFVLTSGGIAKDMDAATSTNAIDVGFVSTEPATKSYTWQVTAVYADADLRGTAKSSASATFTVAALPVFGNLPTKIAGYKAVNANLDFSVASAGAGKVTYSATGLPTGLKINTGTGLITGSPRSLGSRTVTVTAKGEYGEVSKTFTLSVGNLPKAYTKKTYVCLCFDDAGDVKASATVKIQVSGKWTAKFSEGGATTTKKGQLVSLNDGSLAIKAGGVLDIAFNSALGLWSGKSYSRMVYGKAADKADAKWTGTWNSGVFASASPSLGGWVTAKVASSGLVTFSGLIANRFRVSGKGNSVVFNSAFISANLPKSKWVGHGDVRIAHMVKVDGGYAFCSDGTLGGNFKFKSVVYDGVEGSKWSGGDITVLDGATFKTTGGGNVAVPIVMKGTSLSAKSNGYKAKISVVRKSGRVNASYSYGGNGKASGMLYFVHGTLKAGGGGSLGAGSSFAFVIE